MQTVDDFHARYSEAYNSTESESGNGDDGNLILRSFTDDPEMPLEQIKVQFVLSVDSVYVILSILTFYSRY